MSQPIILFLKKKLVILLIFKKYPFKKQANLNSLKYLSYYVCYLTHHDLEGYLSWLARNRKKIIIWEVPHCYIKMCLLYRQERNIPMIVAYVVGC